MSFVNLANRSFNKISVQDKPEGLSMKEIDNRILECKGKIHSIKGQVEELKRNWTALKEDYKDFTFYRSIRTIVKESLQKAVDNLRIEYEDAKDTLEFYKELKNKTLLEADSEKDNSVTNVSSEVLSKLQDEVELDHIEEAFDIIFDAYVLQTGKAETVAGEYVRAISKILYDYYDKDYIFYMGDGLNSTVGNAASYLMTVEDGLWRNSLSEIRENGLVLTDYENSLLNLARDILRYIIDNPELLNYTNTDDYSKFNKDQLYEEQPVFDFYGEVPANVWDKVLNDELSTGEIIDRLVKEFPAVSIDDTYVDDFGGVHIRNLPYDEYLKLTTRFDSVNFD